MSTTLKEMKRLDLIVQVLCQNEDGEFEGPIEYISKKWGSIPTGLAVVDGDADIFIALSLNLDGVELQSSMSKIWDERYFTFDLYPIHTSGFSWLEFSFHSIDDMITFIHANWTVCLPIKSQLSYDESEKTLTVTPKPQIENLHLNDFVFEAQIQFEFLAVEERPYITHQGNNSQWPDIVNLDCIEFLLFTFENIDIANQFIQSNPSNANRAMSGPIEVNDDPPQSYAVAYTIRTGRLQKYRENL